VRGNTLQSSAISDVIEQATMKGRWSLNETVPSESRRHREWSVLTPDCPTYLDRAGERQTLWHTVIKNLLSVAGTTGDNLYSWFEPMCRCCAGKPLVYYSRCVPGWHPELVARVW
jgi:hypothetical protein